MEVTFAICCRNGEKHLAQVVGALLQQKGVDPSRWEILLIDNGSTDATRAIFEQFQHPGLDGLSLEPKPSLRVVVEPVAGQRSARTCAIQNARGTWICFVDDDNVLADNYLLRGLEFALSAAEAGAFGGGSVAKLSAPSPRHFDGFASALAIWQGGDAVRKIGLGRKFTAGMYVRRVAALDAMNEPWLMPGRTPICEFGGEDAELCMQLVRNGWKIYYVPGLTFEHVIPQSRTGLGYLMGLRARQGGEELMLKLAYAERRRPLFIEWLNLMALAIVKMILFSLMFLVVTRRRRWKSLSRAFFLAGYIRFTVAALRKAAEFRRRSVKTCGPPIGKAQCA